MSELIPPPTDNEWLLTEPGCGPPRLPRPKLAVARFLDFLLRRPGQRELLIRLDRRLTILEEKMTALTDAIATLTASVDAANDRLTTLLQPLQQALAAAQSELADLRVADDADKAALAAALTDAATATSQILTEVSQIDTFGAAPVNPTPDPTV